MNFTRHKFEIISMMFLCTSFIIVAQQSESKWVMAIIVVGCLLNAFYYGYLEKRATQIEKETYEILKQMAEEAAAKKDKDEEVQ